MLPFKSRPTAFLLLTALFVLILSPMPSHSNAVTEDSAVINASGEVTMNESSAIPSNLKEEEDKEEEDNNDDDDDDDNDDDENVYYEFSDIADFPYYPEEFIGNGRPAFLCGDPGVDDEDCIVEGEFILQDFVVAGSNLASYGVLHPKFQLFEDFNIGMFLKGNESWKELLHIRRTLQRPSLSWYVDKVARKRWLKEKGFPQPEVYWMKYKSEIGGSTKEENQAEILKNLPTKHGYCAKPTHMSMTMGNWLVDLDPNQPEDTKFSKLARQLKSDDPFDPDKCANSLAEALQREAATVESWALKQVEPGIVIEELWSRRGHRDLPPFEFCIFVVWGRVYTAAMNEVSENRYLDGFFYRDGSAASGCPFKDTIPDWVPWNEMVAIAEALGANKDMIRIDMFVGVPRYSGEDAELQIAISESEIHPTTIFCSPFIADEMARLWIAGYKIGNFEVIPNVEVPADCVQRKKASLAAK
ncbi:hypothetical protein IV203_003841 [Nitzschia inconspicua]|uniref:Uncharacterized protein n=1 Tax=Nitzschia inconspicua TaxID=303405 RepID=A0A9K3L2I7_9STRA|nr:hypothetical protein IV203_003841 [Nitzschia inconspicua]